MNGMTRSLHLSARQHGSSIATIFGGRKRTWAQVYDRVARFAGVLKELGVRSGDRVAILALNSDIFLEYYLAAPWVGAVVVPLNFRWTGDDIAYAIRDSGSRLLLVDDAFCNLTGNLLANCVDLQDCIYIGDNISPDGLSDLRVLMKEVPAIEDMEREGSDLFGIFYTSGTTAAPKGVMLSHKNIWSSAFSVAAASDLNPGDIYLHCAPMFHLADTTHGFAAYLNSATHTFLESYNPDNLIAVIERDRVTHTILVPTMIATMLDSPNIGCADLSSLRILEYGAAPISEDLLRRTIEVLPDVGICQGYGQTEMGPAIAMLGAEDHILEGPKAYRMRSVGRAVECVQVKIANESGEELERGETGEIWATGPNAMLGYYNMPDETANTLVGGWVRTGDAGYMDKDDYIFLVDRIKDIIITGGENVSSLEVENIIYSHPSVSMCAVIGLSDEIWGEKVHAVIVPYPDIPLDEAEIISFCKVRLAGFKCPQTVNIRTEPLPLSGSGKIMKRDLKLLFQD